MHTLKKKMALEEGLLMFLVSFQQSLDGRVRCRPKRKGSKKIRFDKNAVAPIFDVQYPRDPLLPH